MSKYDKTVLFEENESSPLVSGEKIIWSGKPKKKAFIINKSITMLPFALIRASVTEHFLFFIIPFFALHLMPVWIWLGNVVTANKKWENTKYYVTDKRIIIKNGFFAENYQTIYYKDIKNVNLRIGLLDKMLGVGDIYFDFMPFNNGYNYQNAYMPNACFLDIEEYSELYPKLQKVVLDIQTDIEYPNALRPETNPGYNTEYKPNQK